MDIVAGGFEDTVDAIVNTLSGKRVNYVTWHLCYAQKCMSTTVVLVISHLWNAEFRTRYTGIHFTMFLYDWTPKDRKPKTFL